MLFKKEPKIESALLFKKEPKIIYKCSLNITYKFCALFESAKSPKLKASSSKKGAVDSVLRYARIGKTVIYKYEWLLDFREENHRPHITTRVEYEDYAGNDIKIQFE